MTGIERIAAERKRQVEVEGWTAKHDLEHEPFDLAAAAGCYYYATNWDRLTSGASPPPTWPWERSYFKPKDAIRNLERAGALYLAAADRVAAEIDRLERAGESRAEGE